MAILELLDGVRLPDDDRDERSDRPEYHFYEPVGQVFGGDRPTSHVEHLEVGPTWTEPQTAGSSDGWNRIAALAGVAGSAIAALLIFIPSHSWRITLATILGAGLVVAYLTLQLHPKRFYRRLLASWVGIGVLANLVGFIIDGAITRNGADLQFTFSGDVAWWWWIIWAVIAVVLVVADLITQKDIEIDLRDRRPEPINLDDPSPTGRSRRRTEQRRGG